MCDERFTLHDRALPPSFERQTLVIAPGDTRPRDDLRWRGALVSVEQGMVELLCPAGTRARYGAGALLWLDGVPCHALHNPGSGPAVLVSVARRHPSAR